jgi:hypothetical protein
MVPTSLRSWLVLTLAIVGSCSEESEASLGLAGGDEGCWEQEQVPLDQPTSPGPRGQDLLDRVAEPVEVMAFAIANPPSVELYDDPTAEHELTISIEPDGQFATSISTECWNSGDAVPRYVHVPVQIRLISADGAIDARSPAMLQLGEESELDLPRPIDPDDASVRFELREGDFPAGTTIDARTFEGWLPNPNGSGYLSFPTGCGEPEQFPIDASLDRINAQDALQALSAALTDLEFVLDGAYDGYSSNVTASIVFRPSRMTACGPPASYRVLTEAEVRVAGQTSPILGADVSVAVRTRGPDEFFASVYVWARGEAGSPGALMTEEARSKVNLIDLTIELDVHVTGDQLSSAPIRMIAETGYIDREVGDGAVWVAG